MVAISSDNSAVVPPIIVELEVIQIKKALNTLNSYGHVFGRYVHSVAAQ